MANNVVGSLLVNLGLETGRLNSDTKKAARHFNSFDKKAKRSLNSVGRSVSGLMSSMSALTGVAGVLSVAGLGALVKSSIDTADQIGKLSTRIGASTEALSQYKHVAELSGISFNTLTMGFQRMTRRVSEAAGGFGEAKGALIELNLSASDLNQLRPEQQFEAISDALNGVENQADKVRLAMKLFDSEGVSLLQTMEGGAAGIRMMRKEADALGATISKEDAMGAASANDAITRLKSSVGALGLTLAKHLGPVLADIANWLSVNIPGAVKFTVDGFQALRHFVIEGVQVISNGLSGFYGMLSNLPGSLGDTYAKAQEETIAFSTSLEDMQTKWALATGTAKEFKATIGSGSLPAVVGGAGGDDNAEKEQERLDNRLNLKLESLENSLMSEEERLWESYANRQFIVEDAFERGLINETKHQELLLGLKANFEDQMTGLTLKGLTDREKFQKKSALEQTSTVLGEMQSMTNGIAQHSKTAFKINKTASLANAVISGYESFNKTMAAYPYPINIGLAGLGAAATGAQIQAIRATSFNGGGGGTTPSAAGGGGQIINDTPVQTQPQNEPANQGRQITINIEGNILGTEDGIRDVVVRAIEQAETNDEIRLISNG